MYNVPQSKVLGVGNLIISMPFKDNSNKLLFLQQNLTHENLANSNTVNCYYIIVLLYTVLNILFIIEYNNKITVNQVFASMVFLLSVKEIKCITCSTG